MLIYNWYQGCCLKSHSKAINELGKPIVKDVLAFYKKNQRYPNIKETKIILKKSACTNLKDMTYKDYKNLRGEIYMKRFYYDCEYKFRTYSYFLSVADLSIEHEGLIAAYELGFYKGETECSSNFNTDGTSEVKV